MRKIVRADAKKFYCKILFNVECAKSDFDALVDHYKSLCSFYNIGGNMNLGSLTEDEEGDDTFEYYSLKLELEKLPGRYYHLSTVALRKIFLNDLEIIRQLHHINDLEFECPMLSEYLLS